MENGETSDIYTIPFDGIAICPQTGKSSSKVEGVAMCFPGGGIRTAAFCHGILKYITDNDIRVQAFSCVSGGAYTGAAFVESIYHDMYTKKMSYKQAVQHFFSTEKMSKNSGFLIDCHGNVFKGMLESVILIFVFLSWGILLLLDQIPLWFILSAILEPLFGDAIRSDGWEELSSILYIMASITAALWGTYLISICVPSSNVVERFKNAIRISFILCFLLIACLVLIKLTRIIRMNESRADEVVLILVLVFFVAGPIFKIGSPAKRFTTLIVYSAVVSRVSYWHIFKDDYVLFLSGKYTEETWRWILFVSGICLVLPFSLMQIVFFHYYYRWRIQKSFFHSNFFGCSHDFGCFGKKGVTLGDLNDPELPQFIASTVINGWKKEANDDTSYHLVTLETGGRMKVVGTQIETSAKHIGLAEAVSLSAAAFAYRMGSWHQNLRFRFWQVQFGVSLGNWVYTKKTGPERWVAFFLGQAPFTFITCLVVFARISPLFLIFPVTMAILSMVIAVSFPPERVKWVYHLPFILPVFEVFDMIMYGGDPLPLKVYLSDGAHAETLALLPLLDKRKFKKIIICDATEDQSESCDELLSSIKLARRNLKCSVVPLPGSPNSDIESHLRHFVEAKEDSHIQFRIFYDSEQSGEDLTLEYSDIIYIKLRKSFFEQHKSDFREDLHGCCCEMCHSPVCKYLDCIGGSFPVHKNSNQFFTPSMFKEYSKFGFQVVEDFGLKDLCQQ